MVRGGYFGKLLRVNLSTSKIIEQNIEDDLQFSFIGGSGLAAYYLFREVRPDVDPFSPENKLIFTAGPFCGTSFPAGNRYAVVSKSPLTGIWGHATSSGYWGPEFRFTGHDAMIIEGKAAKPVYLYITEKENRIVDASHLAGKKTGETVQTIRNDLGDKRIRVACIGPAGEKMVRYAGIINDTDDAAGRTGMGAVMGSKNLKAVAVRGEKKVQVASEKFNEGSRNLFKIIKDNAIGPLTNTAAYFHHYGTMAVYTVADGFGSLPIKNFKLGKWKDYRQIDGDAFTKITTRIDYCYNCPLGCKKVVTVKDGPFAVGENVRGPEYEAVGAFGSMCLLTSIQAVSKANQLCNDYGIDTISCGSAIAFAMDCYEQGIIDKGKTDGIELTWGNGDAIIKMIEKIGKKEGFGAILAEGTARAAKTLGKGAENLITTVKGLEAPMHDPRAEFALALQYAVVNRGACHLHSRIEDLCLYWAVSYPDVIDYKKGTSHFSYEGKPKIVALGQNISEIGNSLGICHHPASTPSDLWPKPVITTLAEQYSLLTGRETPVAELMKAGERITNLERCFNVLCGIRRKDDTLPKRFLEPKKEGAAANRVPNVEGMLDEYYGFRGWKSNGIPSREKLLELGLKDAAERVSKLS